MLSGKRFSLFALNKNRYFFYFYKFRLRGVVDKTPKIFHCRSPFPRRAPSAKGIKKAPAYKKSACIVMQAPLSVTPEGLEPSTQ